MMKQLFMLVFWVLGLAPLLAQDTFQLAPPYLRYSSVFFEEEARVSMAFAQAGTQIHYTTNGRVPTERDSVYSKAIRINKRATTLTAKVFGAGFRPSETAQVTFYKRGLGIESISTTLPNARYPGNGKRTLVDGQGGIVEHNSQTWLGFQNDTVIVTLVLRKPQALQQILFHFLQDQGAWIFLPEKIEVYISKKDSDAWELLSTVQMHSAGKEDKAMCRPSMLNIRNPMKIKKIVFKIYPLAQMPDWHPGKGQPAWFFMDEIILY